MIMHDLAKVKCWREKRREGGRMEIVGGSPEDSPSLLILINLSGFIWWGKGRGRQREE